MLDVVGLVAEDPADVLAVVAVLDEDELPHAPRAATAATAKGINIFFFKASLHSIVHHRAPRDAPTAGPPYAKGQK